MKKTFISLFIFSILFSFLASMPAYAGSVDLLEHEWNGGWGTSYNSSTKNITFEYGWAGFGLNTGSLETSNWLSMTATFTSNAPKGVLKCDYNEGGSSEVPFENESSKTMSFDTGKTLSKVYIQLESSGTLQLSSITVTTSTTTYTVSVTSSNGTVSGTGDFAENEEVTLTATPNENYSFTSWSTSDVDLSGHENENPLTFTMPDNDVSITANFTACSGQTVTVNVNDGEMGSATGAGSYCAGVQVDLEATPNSGYRFVNWTVTSGSASLDNVNNASTHFTMSNPAAAVTVQANFEVDPCFASLTVQVEDAYLPYGAVSASKGYPTTMIFKEKQAEGSAYRTGCNGRGFMQVQEEGDRELFIPVNITAAGNYKVKARSGQDKKTYINIYAITGDGETITYNSTTYYKKTYKRINEGQGESFAYSDYTDVVSLPIGVCLIGLYSEWSWAAYDEITITCTDGTAFCPNTITMQKSGDASADDPTSSASAAMAGTVVTVTAGEPSDANHYFSGWTASPAVTFADATALSTTFVMPAEDVTITANYGEVVSSMFTYTTSGSGSITCATESGSNVVSGTTIEMTAVPSGDYVFTGWSATAGSFSNASALTTTFTMPAEAATVTATFAQVDNKIITGSETTVTEETGDATLTVTSVSDFDAFNHNVLKFAYSNMDGKYKGQKVAIDAGYSSASSAGATGFGFYYKTEKADDNVAFCFDTRYGQVKWELQATNNVWKYYYFAHAGAAGWNRNGIIIYMNGDDTGNHDIWNEQATHTTYKNGGAFYISEIAATSITSKDDIDSYTYTRTNASNSYGTLCLPMAGTIEGATLYSVAGRQEEGGKLYIVLEEQGTTLAAGEPYIFETDGSTLTATMSGPHSAVNADANGLVGTYQQITAPAYSDPNDLNYVLALDDSNNTVFKKVGENVTVGAYRAYINIKNAGDYSPASAAPGRKYIRFGIEGTEEEQAVEMIYDDASLRTRKIMQNGHLYILRDGHLFTAQGTQIK